MPSRNNISIKNLPQKAETWQLSIRPLSGRSTLDGQPPSQLYMLMLTNLDSELVLATEMFPQPPELSQLQQILFQAMMPEKQDPRHKPHRPQQIQCDSLQHTEVLLPLLAKVGVHVEFFPADEEIDGLFAEITALFQNELAEVPALLSITGVTPELVTNLFAAAESFYRVAPWEHLADDQPLAVYFPGWEKRGYVQLMGNAGLEFGLVLFWTWEDLLSVYRFSSDPLDHMPVSGWRALSFESLESLPSGDQRAVKEYGLKAAGKQVYPFPTVFTPETLERPDRQELLVYTVLMRAIPNFIDKNLLPGEDGEFLPGHGEWTIETTDGPVRVEISYPAAIVDLEAG